MTGCFAFTVMLAIWADDFGKLQGRWKAVTVAGQGHDADAEFLKVFEPEFLFNGKSGSFSQVQTWSTDENGTEQRLREQSRSLTVSILGKIPKASILPFTIQRSE